MQSHEGVSDPAWVCRRHQQAVVPILDEVSDAPNGGGYYSSLVLHGFQCGDAKTLEV